MTEGSSGSILNLGDLAKPADTLIKKISNAVGGLCAPFQIERVAKAEARAAIIKAKAEIQVTALQRRAMNRFLDEEAQRQQNMEKMAADALPQLTDTSRPEAIEDDWITNFFDKCRIVSDSDMQQLWSRILAGEANVPGSFSKRTVNFLSDLDKMDSELFEKLCGFMWSLGPLIFDSRAKIYNSQGIDFSSLTHLESIGLIQFNSLAGFNRVGLPKYFETVYYGESLEMEMAKEHDNELELGQVLLTRVGMELAPICSGKPVPGFFDYVKNYWASHLRKEKPRENIKLTQPAT